jgi:hypothetical protein
VAVNRLAKASFLGQSKHGQVVIFMSLPHMFQHVLFRPFILRQFTTEVTEKLSIITNHLWGVQLGFAVFHAGLAALQMFAVTWCILKKDFAINTLPVVTSHGKTQLITVVFVLVISIFLTIHLWSFKFGPGFVVLTVNEFLVVGNDFTYSFLPGRVLFFLALWNYLRRARDALIFFNH